MTIKEVSYLKQKFGFELAFVDKPKSSLSFLANNHLNIKYDSNDFNVTATHKGYINPVFFFL